MSKRKPDQVIEFRISLQDREKEMFDSMVGAYQIDKFSEAVDQALSFQNVYLGITLIEIATGKEILFGTPNDLNDLIADVRTWWAANKDEFGPGLWNFFKGLFERAPLTEAQQAAIEQTKHSRLRSSRQLHSTSNKPGSILQQVKNIPA